MFPKKYPKKVIFEIDEHEACVNFYYQLVAGDGTDNIPSIKEFTTIKMLQHKKIYAKLSLMDTEKEMMEFVYSLYNNNIEAIEEVGNLVFMRQHAGQMYEYGREYYGI